MVSYPRSPSHCYCQFRTTPVPIHLSSFSEAESIISVRGQSQTRQAQHQVRPRVPKPRIFLAKTKSSLLLQTKPVAVVLPPNALPPAPIKKLGLPKSHGFTLLGFWGELYEVDGDHIKVIRKSTAQIRGELKAIARSTVELWFGFYDHISKKQENQALYKKLITNNTFLYEVHHHYYQFNQPLSIMLRLYSPPMTFVARGAE